MPEVYNYINALERTFLEATAFATMSPAVWQSDSPLSVDVENYQDSARGALKSNPTSVNFYVTYNLWGSPSTDIPSQFAITTPIDKYDAVETFIWLRTSVSGTFYLKTTLTKVIFNGTLQRYELSTNPADVHESIESSESVFVGVGGDSSWHLLRSIPIILPVNDSNYSVAFKFRAELSTITNAVTDISRPTIQTSAAPFRNRFLEYCYMFIPEMFLEKDRISFTNNEPSFPLTRMVDICTDTSDAVLTLMENMTYVDISEGYGVSDPESFSTLVNPAVSDIDWLPWLAHFRGRELLVTYEPATEGVSWTSFILDESTLDGVGVLSYTGTLGDIPGGVDAYFRWQVETGAYGHNAGSLKSMISAIQLLLTGTKTIIYADSLNSITFYTSYLETHDAVIGDLGLPSQAVLDIIEPARRLGMTVAHVLTDGSPLVGELLLEDGTNLLQEIGDLLLWEGV